MCDTFVALPTETDDQSVILAKNSDREANEMQSLEYFEGANFDPGEKLKCTYIEIDQVEKTNAILIGRPFWMWGAEMGTNDKGVAIGNEAIWTKMPVHKKNDRLLGMDLLRLALERADTAKQALDVICDLMEKHGQGGIAGYKDKSMAYHNSYLIADKTEAIPRVRQPKQAANDVGDPTLKGWKARSCRASVKDGIVTVTGLGKASFLGVGSGVTGPAKITLHLRSTRKGQGKIHVLRTRKEADLVSVPFEVSADKWQNLVVDIPASGPLGILRVFLPASMKSVEIDWIELKGKGQPRRWDF